VSVATTSHKGTPSVRFDFPVIKQALEKNIQNKKRLEDILLSSSYGNAPLVVVHDEYLLVSSLDRFDQGIESVATKISTQDSSNKGASQKLFSAIEANLDGMGEAKKMIVILPTSKTSMNRVVLVSKLLQTKYMSANLVMSTEVL